MNFQGLKYDAPSNLFSGFMEEATDTNGQEGI